jgi:hypothetical protein
MATIEEARQSQIRNIETTYGRPIADWVEIIQASGVTKHNDVVAMLKTDYGMAHGAAHRVSLTARDLLATDTPPSPGGEGDQADGLYAAKKAGLRPIHDRLMAVVNEFGTDVDVALKRSYLSLRRARQFAMIQPSTSSRVDVGLILKGFPPTERLETAGSWNALFTHRVRLTRPADVDEELIGWLKEAYDSAG